MPTADEQYAYGNPMLAQVEEPQTPEELAAQQLAYQLLVQQESAQPSGYPTAQLGNPMPEEPPVAAQPPPADLSNRDSYIAAQLRFADMVRQRNEEQGGPNALQQPNAEELALKEQLSQAGNPLGPQPAPRMPVADFQRPRTNLDVARHNLNMAAQREHQDIIRLNSSQTFKTQSELRNLVAHVQQQQAEVEYRRRSQDYRNRGFDDATSSANAWRDISPQVMASGSSGLFGAAVRASQPPPVAPEFVQGDPTTGMPAHFRTRSGVSQVRSEASFDFDKTVSPIFDTDGKKIGVRIPRSKGADTIYLGKNGKLDLTPTSRASLHERLGKVVTALKVKKIDPQLKAITENEIKEISEALGVELQSEIVPPVPVKLGKDTPATTNWTVKAKATATSPPPGSKSDIQPTSPEVIRFTKDGRKAIFDAATKTFLRYAP